MVTLNNSMIMDTGEANAYTVLKRLEIQEQVKRLACRILSTAAKKCTSTVAEPKCRINRLKTLIAEFK